jgi:hypothetical protein
VTVSIQQLQALAAGAGLKFFMAPDRPVMLMGFTGMFGSYQVIATTDLDGRFMQLRTMGYGSCGADHPHLEAVLKVLAALDYRLRLTKFAWDESDGEIIAYADLWLEDATLTQAQFAAMLRAFVPAIDLGHERIVKTMQTGVDPGTQMPAQPGGAPAPSPAPPAAGPVSV